jgi:hypothetical protein
MLNERDLRSTSQPPEQAVQFIVFVHRASCQAVTVCQAVLCSVSSGTRNILTGFS